MRALIFLFLILMSCSPYRWMEKNHNKAVRYLGIEDSVRTELKIISTVDSVYSPPDSSFYELWVECDSNNEVVVKSYRENIGEKTRSNAEFQKYNSTLIYTNSIYRDSILTLQKRLSERRTEIKYIRIPYEVEKPVRFVPRFWKVTGGIGMLAVTLVIVFVVIKVRSFTK